MYYGKVRPASEVEWEKNYGDKTEKEMGAIVRGMLSSKFAEREARRAEKQTQQDEKYNLPYSGIIKAIAKAKKQIEELEGKPEKLLSEAREQLEAEYDELIARGMWDNNKELWVSGKMVDYMKTEEFKTAKQELQQAKEDFAIFLVKKEEWEKDNADIIEAERIRTRRAELLQADPEALRALGIEPVAVKSHPSSDREENTENSALKGLGIDADALFEVYWKNGLYKKAD